MEWIRSLLNLLGSLIEQMYVIRFSYQDNVKKVQEIKPRREHFHLCPLTPPLFNGCDDIWTWSHIDRSSEVRLFGPGSRVAHFHPNWSRGSAAVLGTRVLNNGRYYWELCLSRRIFGTSMMFGVATKRARLHVDAFINLLGEDENSWGLSHKGLLWHGGRWSRYTKPFSEDAPTTIGVLFDGVAGTLTYYKDGESLGVAFSGLQNIQDALYPIACSTAAKTEIRIETCRREFVNLQDRCRAVIVKCILRKDSVEHLFLPPKIKNFLREGYLDVKSIPFRSKDSLTVQNIVSINFMKMNK